MAGKTLRFFNLTGGLNTVQDLVTLNSGTNRTESPDMKNVEYYKYGGIQTMKGNKLIGIPNPKTADTHKEINFGIEYIRGNETTMLVADGNSMIFEYNDDNTFTNIFDIESIEVTKGKDYFGELNEFNVPNDLPSDKAMAHGDGVSKHLAVSYNNGIVFTNGYSLLYYNKDTNTIINNIPLFKIQKTKDIEVQYYAWVNGESNVDAVYLTKVTSGSSIDVYTADYTKQSTKGTISTNDEGTKILTYNDRVYTRSSTSDPDIRTEYEIYYEGIPIAANAIASYKGRLWLACNKLPENTIKAVYKVNDSGEISETTYEKLTNEELDTYRNILVYSGVGLGITTDVWTEGQEGDDAGYFSNFFEDYSDFTALMPWAEYLAIHKLQNTYLLDGTNSDSTTWELKPYSDNSTDGQQGIVIANNSYYTYCRKAGGIYPLVQRSIYNTTFQGAELSAKIKDSLEYIDLTKLNQIYAAYHPLKSYILFYIPTLINGKSNHCFIYDVKTKTWLYREIPQYPTCAFRYDNEIYIGTEDGKVLKEFSGKTFDGDPIDFYWLSPSYLWGGGTNNTTSSEFRVKLLNSNTNNFQIESLNNGSTVKGKTRTVTNRQDTLNGLVWDVGFGKCEYTTQENRVRRYTNIGDRNPVNFTYYNTLGIWVPKAKLTTWYKYTTDKYGYLITPTEIQDYSYNVPVYEYDVFNGVGNQIGNNQNIKFYDIRPITTGETSNYTDYEKSTSYAWQLQSIKKICFKNSNGVMAWVPIDGGNAETNLKTKQVVKWIYIEEFANTKWRMSQQMYDEFNEAFKSRSTLEVFPPDKPNDIQFNFANTNGKWATEYMQGSGRQSNSLYTMVQTGKFKDDGLNMFIYLYRNNGWELVGRAKALAFKGQSSIPISSKDYKDQEYPSGTTPISNGITKTYTPTSVTPDTASITIQYNGSDIKLTRYTAGDIIGTTIDNLLYTKEIDPTTDDLAYSNKDFTGTGKTISQRVKTSGNYIVVSDEKYYRSSVNDGIYLKAVPSIKTSIFVDGEPTTISLPSFDYDSLEAGYDILKSVTDTAWDYSEIDNKYILIRPDREDIYRINRTKGIIYEDVTPMASSGKYTDIPVNLRGEAWLDQGYITKRMILPKQYYQTVQFRFSGSTLNDSICMAGFEVDGIELTEVPH